ncbi:hypothetical protein LguiA_023131 [Lonicera macranthoides]
MMEKSNNYNYVPYNSVESEVEKLGPPSQGFLVDHMGHVNANVRPAELNFPEVKPVHNFSIQTGEEFALEFMRDRVNPRKPFIPYTSSDPSLTTGYLELKGILGISHAGSEGSDVSMLSIVEKGSKDERKNSSLYEEKSNYGSMMSVPRTSSDYSNRTVIHEYSSGASDSSSTKIKVLCSFGGKILPRPSDGKLRYVGGDTRIIRIRKDITWGELWQKTVAIYYEVHIIKYQLPGEDLDALVSVSCDEDLQNMMEECNVLGDGGGSKKLRMFLFSISDLDDTHFDLANSGGDSEIQYVVAVNGMDAGSRRDSGLHGLASSSANNLDELDGPIVSRAAIDFVGTNTSPLTTQSSQAQAIPPSSSNAYETNSQFYQGQMLHQGEANKQYPLQYSSEIHPSSYTPFAESSVLLPYNGLVGQQVGSTEEQPSSALRLQDPQPQVREVKQKGDVSSIQQDGEHDNSQSSRSDYLNQLPPSPYDGKSSKNEGRRHQEHVRVSSPLDAVNPVNNIPKPSGNELNTTSTASALECSNSQSDLIDLSYLEPPVPPQRVFHSLRIPRDQSESLNRLTKSDDSLGSQFLITHSRSDVVAHDLVTESVEELHNQNTEAVLDPVDDNFIVKENQVLNARDNNKNNTLIEEAAEVSSDFSTNNTQGHVQPSAKNVIVGEQSTGVSRRERGDILIDINDRFPRDFLTDIFSKAMISEDLSDDGPVQNDGSGLSMNIANHEPKHWSYFQKLAHDEFGQKDDSLIDQDHIGFSSVVPEVDEEVSPAHKFTPLKEDGVSTSQIDSRNNLSEDPQIEVPSTMGAETIALNSDYSPSQVEYSEGLPLDGMVNTRIPESEYEDGIRTIGLPPLDPSLGEFDISSLQIIKNEDLEELRELGAGTFGTVYHGKWRGTDVAIKRIKKSCFAGRSSEQERLTVEFWHEAEILSKLHHPNVVAFYGVVQDGPGGTLATVAEFMVDGSLRHVLLRKDRQLDHRKKLIIAMDAAFGMEYLHSKNIVHFDLKCDNLLVNLKDPSRPICKVGDFGLSKIKRNTLVSGGVRGTLPWMAPELLNGGSNKVSEKVDVFSFGIVLWEILTGEEPYANMHYGAIIGGIVNNTLRPNVPNWCDHEWRRLMEQCWSPNPMVRPSFTEITRRLRVMSAACQTKAQAHKASH